MVTEPQSSLIDQTREAAIAVNEDFSVLCDICGKAETRAVDLRHTSAILRRWLVERQLERVASPRVGRLHIMAIDNNSVYRAERTGRIVSFVSGGASIHGVYLAAGIMNKGGQPLNLADYHPDTLETFRLDTFAKQRVIYSQGQWFSRQQIIKFVANADHGVHGHGAREKWEKQLSEFRNEISISLVDGPDGKPMPSITWKDGIKAGETNLEKYSPTKVNGVLLELLSTVHFLVKSPEVIDLMKVIETEMT